MNWMFLKSVSMEPNWTATDNVFEGEWYRFNVNMCRVSTVASRFYSREMRLEPYRLSSHPLRSLLSSAWCVSREGGTFKWLEVICGITRFDRGKQTSLSVSDGRTPKMPPRQQNKGNLQITEDSRGELKSESLNGGKGRVIWFCR